MSTETNYDAILSDVDTYLDSRDIQDFIGFTMAEFDMESKEVRQQKRAELNAKIARGKALYEQGYRVRKSDREIVLSDAPEALAVRRVSAGHIAYNEAFRWQYLTKKD